MEDKRYERNSIRFYSFQRERLQTFVVSSITLAASVKPARSMRLGFMSVHAQLFMRAVNSLRIYDG